MQRRLPILGASGLLIDNDSVLLIQRGHAPAAGQWSLPGGKVEFGEPLAAAVMREFAEETGLRVQAGRLLSLLDYMERDGAGAVSYHASIAVFTCTPLAGEARPGDDAADVRWVRLADLPAFCAAGNRITRTALWALRLIGQPVDGLVDLQLAAARPDDELTVRTILSNAFTVMQHRMTFQSAAQSEDEAWARRHCESGLVLIGSVDGQPVATGRIIPRGSDAYLARIGVDQAYQGLGLGRRLVAALEDLARSRGFLRATLKTSEQMLGNEEFYRSCGYEIIERIGTDKHLFVMAKTL